MHLYAAVVPPREVSDRAAAVVADVEAPEPPPAEDHGHAGVLGRLVGRSKQEPPADPAPSGPLLDLMPAERMQVPIARFGNLTTPDAVRLTDAMRVQAATWHSPRMYVRGGTALEWPGDTSVWAKLDGDLDQLQEVARGVTRVAQGLHLFVDRRGFRPLIEVARVNDRTTPEYLEALVAAMDGFESSRWFHSTLALLVPSDSGSSPPFKHYAEVPLGPPTA